MTTQDISVFTTGGTLALIGFSGAAVCKFMLYRNDWVFKQLNDWNEKDQEDYEKHAPEYEDAMRKWWVWDMNKLRK